MRINALLAQEDAQHQGSAAVHRVPRAMTLLLTVSTYELFTRYPFYVKISTGSTYEISCRNRSTCHACPTFQNLRRSNSTFNTLPFASFAFPCWWVDKDHSCPLDDTIQVRLNREVFILGRKIVGMVWEKIAWSRSKSWVPLGVSGGLRIGTAQTFDTPYSPISFKNYWWCWGDFLMHHWAESRHCHAPSEVASLIFI